MKKKAVKHVKLASFYVFLFTKDQKKNAGRYGGSELYTEFGGYLRRSGCAAVLHERTFPFSKHPDIILFQLTVHNFAT